MHVGTYIEPATDQPAINIYIKSPMKSFSSFSAIDKRNGSPKELHTLRTVTLLIFCSLSVTFKQDRR